MADRNTVIRGNQIKDATVTADELALSVAGAGIVGGAGTALSVNVDDSSVEVDTDIVRVKDAGITAAKLAAAVAGNGLAGGAGTALSVNVDDSTIEINADSLRVKADGITSNEINLAGDYAYTGNITVPAPAGGTSVVNKDYVDGVASGLDVKESVRSGVTSNVASLSGPQTVGGVAVVAGDRVLLMGQSTASQNGIYIVNAGAWTRAEDADSDAEVTAGLFTFVEEGDEADNGYVLTTDNPITVGTTSLAFAQFSGAGQITAGAGLSKSGNTLNVNVIGACEIDTDAVDVKDLGIDTARLANDAVDKDKINADIAGAALVQAAGGELDVNVDDSSIEVNADALRVKALGISNAMLAGSISDDKLVEDYIKTSEVDGSSIEFAGGNLNVKALGIATGMIAADAVDKTKVAADIAGLGLSQAVGGEFDVNVDDSSIEINVDTLQVKAGGITSAMLAESYVEQTDVDNASIEFAGGTLNVKALGVTNAMLAGSIADSKLLQITTANKVDGSALVADTVVEAALDVHNAPTVGYVMSYTSNGMEWISGTADAVNESDFIKSTVNAVGAETVLTSMSGSAAVLANTVQVYLNGLLQEEGAGNDYTIVLATGVVTFLTALEAGDIVIMNAVLDN